MAASWHLAPSLAQLRAEVNRRWPGRDKRSDGSLGDAAHSARASDHNPNSRRSVNALDFDEDGIDAWALKDKLVRDSRVNYVIYERRIWSRSRGFSERPYSGANPHDKHLHVSILQSRSAEEDTRPWGIVSVGGVASGGVPTTPPAPKPTAPKGELTMAQIDDILRKFGDILRKLDYISEQIKVTNQTGVDDRDYLQTQLKVIHEDTAGRAAINARNADVAIVVQRIADKAVAKAGAKNASIVRAALDAALADEDGGK